MIRLIKKILSDWTVPIQINIIKYLLLPEWESINNLTLVEEIYKNPWTIHWKLKNKSKSNLDTESGIFFSLRSAISPKIVSCLKAAFHARHSAHTSESCNLRQITVIALAQAPVSSVRAGMSENMPLSLLYANLMHVLAWRLVEEGNVWAYSHPAYFMGDGFTEIITTNISPLRGLATLMVTLFQEEFKFKRNFKIYIPSMNIKMSL